MMWPDSRKLKNLEASTASGMQRVLQNATSSRFRRQGTLALLLGPVSCSTITLRPPENSSPHTRLSELNDKEFLFTSEDDVERYSLVGHQYGLVVLPLGRIFIESVSTEVRRYIEQDFIEHGGKKVLRQGKQAPFRINLHRIAVALSAYDFIFFRRVTCKLEAQIISSNGSEPKQMSSVSERYGELRKFGFRPELESVWKECRKRFAGKVRALSGF